MPVAHCYNPDEAFACEEVVLGHREEAQSLVGLATVKKLCFLPFVTRIRDDTILHSPTTVHVVHWRPSRTIHPASF